MAGVFDLELDIRDIRDSDDDDVIEVDDVSLISTASLTICLGGGGGAHYNPVEDFWEGCSAERQGMPAECPS